MMTTAAWIVIAIVAVLVIAGAAWFAVELIADKAISNDENEADHPGTE